MMGCLIHEWGRGPILQVARCKRCGDVMNWRDVQHKKEVGAQFAWLALVVLLLGVAIYFGEG